MDWWNAESARPEVGTRSSTSLGALAAKRFDSPTHFNIETSDKCTLTNDRDRTRTTKMPGAVAEPTGERKRKRKAVEADQSTAPKPKARKVEKDGPRSAGIEEEILLLESQILESRKHYNSIATLLRHVEAGNGQDQASITAAVALCRVFCRLMALGSFSKPEEAPKSERTIVQWLRGQLEAYKELLLSLLSMADLVVSSTALTLLMRLLKGETESLNQAWVDKWRSRIFKTIVSRLIAAETPDAIREEFVDKYLQPFDDVRYFTFACLTYVEFNALRLLKC